MSKVEIFRLVVRGLELLDDIAPKLLSITKDLESVKKMLQENPEFDDSASKSEFEKLQESLKD